MLELVEKTEDRTDYDLNEKEEVMDRIRDERKEKEIETDRKREEVIDSKETENKVEIENVVEQDSMIEKAELEVKSIEKVGGEDKEIIDYLECDEKKEREREEIIRRNKAIKQRIEKFEKEEEKTMENILEMLELMKESA